MAIPLFNRNSGVLFQNSRDQIEVTNTALNHYRQLGKIWRNILSQRDLNFLLKCSSPYSREFAGVSGALNVRNPFYYKVMGHTSGKYFHTNFQDFSWRESVSLNGIAVEISAGLQPSDIKSKQGSYIMGRVAGINSISESCSLNGVGLFDLTINNKSGLYKTEAMKVSLALFQNVGSDPFKGQIDLDLLNELDVFGCFAYALEFFEIPEFK